MNERPNILMLVMDQFRHQLLSQERVETPNLKALSKEGVDFQDAYTPCPLCSPARASLLTGKYPHNHGILNNVHEEDALIKELPDQPTMNTILKEEGYYQAHYGKWHVGREKGPLEWGFQEGVVIDSNIPEGELDFLYKPSPLLPIQNHPPFGTLRGGVEETDSYTIAQLGIDFLRGHSSEDRPFFLRLDWPGPHFPYIIPEPYASMYKKEDIPLDPNFHDNLKDKPQIQQILRRKYRSITSMDQEDWQRMRAYYYGYATMLDEQVGRVLKVLKESGREEETIVLFTADHGDMIGAHGLFNKGALPYEEIYHVPLLIKSPGGPSRKVRGGVLTLDIMPTILEATGTSIPPVDGMSLWPILQGEEMELRENLYMEFHGDELGLYSQRILLNPRYKYVYNGPDIDELYDLDLDPHEIVNLVDDPRYQEISVDLKRRLQREMETYQDPLTGWISTVLE